MNYVYKSSCGQYYYCSDVLRLDEEETRVAPKHNIGTTVFVAWDWDNILYIGKVKGYCTMETDKGSKWGYVIERPAGVMRVTPRHVRTYISEATTDVVERLREEMDDLKEILTRILRDLEEDEIKINE